MAKLPADYTLRFATPLDIPALIAADRAASELFRPTGLIPDMATIPESIPADIMTEAIEQGMVLAVADAAGAVGFAMARLQDKTLYLDQVSVDPAHGRKGLGKALVQELFVLADEHRCNVVALSTFREVAWNGPFYRRLGFKEVPRRQMSDWMLAIEAAQAETLDVSARCFMQKPVRRPLLSKRKSNLEQMTNPLDDGTPS